MKNFLKTANLSRIEIEMLFDLAMQYKNGQIINKPLAGKSVALVFFNPSLRTRASMQVGIYELGGNAVILEPGGSSWILEHAEGAIMDAEKTEHLKEFVRVLERYVSAIGVCCFAELKDWETERTEPILSAFERYATKPIINLESAMHHPCQALTDMFTIREKLGNEPKKVLLTWTCHPKPLPLAVPHSFVLAAAQMGHQIIIAHPGGYELDRELLNEAFNAGGKIEITNDVNKAFEGVDVVYAESWGSKRFYGAPEQERTFRAGWQNDWIVDLAKMQKTNNAIFMNCLPVLRNVVVTDAVIDSPNSVVIDQAENRLHVQKAIMTKLLSKLSAF